MSLPYDDPEIPQLLTSEEALELLDEYRNAAWRLVSPLNPVPQTKSVPQTLRESSELAWERFHAVKELLHIALTGLHLPEDHALTRRPRLGVDQPRKRNL